MPNEYGYMQLSFLYCHSHGEGAALKDKINKSRQILVKKGAYWQPVRLATGTVLQRLAGEYEVWLTACSSASLQIAQGITSSGHA